jgi:uncharacterized repeat protein (TIGR03803 family)
LAKDGTFYGVTAGGGIGYGTVYRLSTSGVLTTLAWFPGDAVNPVGKLVEAVDGNLYGVAGGLEGTVFRLARDGGLTTVAWFDGANGETPVGLIQARDGNFYGECYTGGIPGDWYGTVFKMTPGGVISRVVSFTGYGGDRPGRYPWAGVVEGNDGNLYGTTWQGGTPQAGNVFRIIMPGPLLSSARIDDSLILSWRTNYTGYVLQSSTDLSRNEWIDCINTTSIVSGQYVVTNSLSDSSRFFRLSKISQP